ncbi:MAG: S46 family peptidase [Oligoflexia bacterium]|nr:S46 family peptidase [Oligoflexia bacterium]
MLTPLLMLTLSCPALLGVAHADEGMWLPEQLPEQAQRLDELGLEIPVEQLADPLGEPLGAIVSLGFCSASFVSPQGLILTNHHCVEGYLQMNSSADADRSRDGYLAGSQAEELPAGPSARLTVVEAMTDVTDQILARVGKRTSDRQRQARIEAAKKALVATCEEPAGRRCRVAGYYGGASYRLIQARELRDLRIVYAPPQSIGSYGAEIDNWMWPRHSGDFAMLRAYVGPDGDAADYAKNNVPYRPPHYLSLDPSGAQDGELAMVAGFPGHTNRYAMASALRFSRDTAYPWSIDRADEVLAMLADESAKDPEAAARLAAPIGWIGNGRKYRQGMLDNFEASDVVERVEAREQAFRDWVAADKKRQRSVAPVLDELDALATDRRATWKTDDLFYRLVRYTDLLRVATTALRLADEGQKPDADREPGFQERDRDRIAARFASLERSLWLPLDRRTLTRTLTLIEDLPADQGITPVDEFLADHGGVDGAVAALFADTSLADTDTRLGLLEQDPATLRASANPWLQFAASLESWQAPRRARDKARAGASLRLMPRYMEALIQARSRPVYPDANGSLRVTFGQVQGYSPRDGVWNLPHTTVAGVVAKASDAPFDAPPRLLKAAADAPDSRWADPELHDVPVDFLTTLDTTGGNSGSATLNAKGQLIGLIFDGNYEAMSADWLFDPALTRSIHVDIRYLLWMLEDVEHADWLVEELGQAPR